jgi:inorganic pyrophosphatase
MNKKTQRFKELLSTIFKSHPWHGVPAGPQAPAVVTCYIEIVPPGSVKLELDKTTGHLRIDRPQRFSSVSPTLYGFIPQTYCGDGIGKLANQHAKRKITKGDGDPLDICVLTEKEIVQGDLLLSARVIGGLLMVDKGEADDKIIAVLDADITFGHIKDLSEVPPGVIERLKHYFLSYKRPPGQSDSDKSVVYIDEVYGPDRAHQVIRQSMQDYETAFGSEESRLEELRQLLSEGLHENCASQKPKDGKRKKDGKKSRK